MTEGLKKKEGRDKEEREMKRREGIKKRDPR